MKKSILLLASVFVLGFVSCSDDDDCTEARAQELSDRVTETSAAYIMDIQNDDKCKDFVDAVNDFIDLVENCPDVTSEDIDDLRDAIADLPCN